MGHRLQYDHSTVIGYETDEKGHVHKRATDDFIHLRHQDPILMACKRSYEMARCDRFDVDTKPSFDRWVDDAIYNFVPQMAAAAPEMDW